MCAREEIHVISSTNNLNMDPKPSFNLPLLQRQAYRRGQLKPKVIDHMSKTSEFAFKSTEPQFYSKRLEDELSPRLTMKLNPGYRVEYGLTKSHSNKVFKDHRLMTNRREFIMTDKAHFRRKDELTIYAEQYLKSRMIYTKK